MQDMQTEPQETGKKSIEEFCSSTWQVLYRFIYFRVQNRQEAEDITQETYVKAIAAAGKDISVINNQIGYLKTIALNILRDKWRRKKVTEISTDFTGKVENEIPSVEDGTEERAVREAVMKALDCLNEEQRRVIELRILQSYTVAETAAILHKKEGTVRVIQLRGLRKLSRILGKNFELK